MAVFNKISHGPYIEYFIKRYNQSKSQQLGIRSAISEMSEPHLITVLLFMHVEYQGHSPMAC
jgi:hypothetical protein